MRGERRYIAFALQSATWLLGERWLEGEKERDGNDVGVNWASDVPVLTFRWFREAKSRQGVDRIDNVDFGYKQRSFYP